MFNPRSFFLKKLYSRESGTLAQIIRSKARKYINRFHQFYYHNAFSPLWIIKLAAGTILLLSIKLLSIFLIRIPKFLLGSFYNKIINDLGNIISAALSDEKTVRSEKASSFENASDMFAYIPKVKVKQIPNLLTFCISTNATKFLFMVYDIELCDYLKY